MIRYDDLPEALRRRVDDALKTEEKNRRGGRIRAGEEKYASLSDAEDSALQAGSGAGAVRPKYGNRKTAVNGILFDSAKEARRYCELMALLEAGQISDLRLQRNFTLTEGYTDTGGKRVKPIVYRADFVYISDGREVVEDVKSRGTRTKEYLLKKKLMKNKGIEITEI